jgi:hypothetical protein
MRAATSSFDWMPALHTPAEDLAFMEGLLSRHLPDRRGGHLCTLMTICRDNNGRSRAITCRLTATQPAVG